jgi:peroxin-5
MPMFIQQPRMQSISPTLSIHAANKASWEEEFQKQESILAVSKQLQEQVQQQRPAVDHDELSLTAGLVLEAVREEQNPKFKNSAFISLMQNLRDRELVLEGNEFVEASQAIRAPTADVKGKGKAVVGDHPHIGDPRTIFDASALLQTQERHYVAQESEEDAYWRQENAEYTKFWEDANAVKPLSMSKSSEGWDELQRSWDQFEATNTGIRPLNTYQFQQQNPYLSGDSSMTRHHLTHHDFPVTDVSVSLPAESFAESFQNVLQLEAAVQKDMSNAGKWFELGVKQQENEREKQARQALEYAIELDPSHLPSWLALSVSHTNDGNRQAACNAIREWVMRNDNYAAPVKEFFTKSPENTSASQAEKFNHLVECLMMIARLNVDSIDADVQIALGVLFNTNEVFLNSIFQLYCHLTRLRTTTRLKIASELLFLLAQK